MIPEETSAMNNSLASDHYYRDVPRQAVDELIRIDHVVEPRPALARRYGQMYEDYRQVYDALAPVFRRMHTTP